MEKNEYVAGDVLKELQEIEEMSNKSEKDIISITYECSTILTIVCCTP